MSLVTPPKTNFTTIDGVINTDLNQIGENLNSLEQSKYQSGDNITAATVTTNTLTAGEITKVVTSTVNTGQGDNECYAMNQNVRTTDAPTFAGGTFNGAILPTTTADGSWALTTTPAVIPRGIYSIKHIVSTGLGHSIVEMFVNGLWQTFSDGFVAVGASGTSGDVIISDGTNFRISIGSGTGTVYYRRF